MTIQKIVVYLIYQKQRTMNKYKFTGKKGSIAIASINGAPFFKISKGDVLTLLSDEFFRNGEPHIKTSVGVFPSVFFY